MTRYPDCDMAEYLTIAQMVENWGGFPIWYFETIGHLGDDLAFDVWHEERKRRRGERIEQLARLIGGQRND